MAAFLKMLDKLAVGWKTFIAIAAVECVGSRGAPITANVNLAEAVGRKN
jgi:hypothetical protein